LLQSEISLAPCKKAVRDVDIYTLIQIPLLQCDWNFVGPSRRLQSLKGSHEERYLTTLAPLRDLESCS